MTYLEQIFELHPWKLLHPYKSESTVVYNLQVYFLGPFSFSFCDLVLVPPPPLSLY